MVSLAWSDSIDPKSQQACLCFHCQGAPRTALVVRRQGLMDDKAPPLPPLPSPFGAPKFVHNTYNISTAAIRANQGSNDSPAAAANNSRFNVQWSIEEHDRFVAALEQFGATRATSAHAAWHAIAAAVGSRSVAEIKAHATWYLVQLQYASQPQDMWTPAQDAAFEQLLSMLSSMAPGGCYPWEAMAAEIPGKTPQALRQRYQLLCNDILRIEGTEDEHPLSEQSMTRKRTASGSVKETPDKRARQTSVSMSDLTSPLVAPGVSFSFLPLPSPMTPRFPPLYSEYLTDPAPAETTRAPSPATRSEPTPSSSPLPDLSMPTPTNRMMSPMFFPPPPSPFGLTPMSARHNHQHPHQSTP